MSFHSNSLLLWGVIFICLVEKYAGNYINIYGGVIAQIIENASMSNPDVAEAVKLAVKINNIIDFSVTDIEKQRLYFTTDGVSPMLYERQFISHTNGKPCLQQNQLVIGLMYSFVLSHNRTLNTETIETQFIVSRDRNKKYHIFKQASSTISNMKSLSILEDHRLSLSKMGNGLNTCRNIRPQPFMFNPPIPLVSFGMHALRIASYNIWNVNSEGESYESRLSRMSHFIRSLNVDIFGFQEVRLEVATASKASPTTRNPPQTQSQISQLSSQLPGYHFVYQPAMLYMEKILERKEEGLAIFSQYPILSSDYKLLYRNDSDVEDYHQRICLHAELLIPKFGPVHVFVSHLSLSEKSRERSVVEVWQYMQKFAGIKLLVGDMNAEPHSSAIRFLTGEVSLGGIYTVNLHDTWKVANIGNDAGLTFSALEDKPVKRIDYIFTNLAYSSGVHIASSEVIFDTNICFLPCSDHHILLTVLNSTL